MKKKIITLSMALAGIFFWGCEKQEELAPATVTATNESNTETACCPYPEIIDFNKYPIGFISEVNAASGLGPIGVYGVNPKFAGKNAAMIFDTNNPTGGDTDLKTPNPPNNDKDLKKVLIVSEDLDAADPDDSDYNGSQLIIDFSKVGPVAVCSLDIIDLQSDEGENGKVEFFNSEGTEIDEQALPTPGENRIATANFGLVEGVIKMKITLNGSSAIDNIKFCVKKEEPPTDKGCTRTQGYWRTHSKYGPAPYDNTWAELGEDNLFYLSGKTYYQAINTSSAGGNAYYILARQFIAAKLNILAGASAPDEVTDAIEDAEDLFSIHLPATIGLLPGSSPLRKEFIRLAGILADYNEGETGPGHCKDEEPEK